jgi:hypothetical protein
MVQDAAGRQLDMLRMYIAQLCFGLSTEDGVYVSQAIHGFDGIDLTRGRHPMPTPCCVVKRQ